MTCPPERPEVREAEREYLHRKPNCTYRVEFDCDGYWPPHLGNKIHDKVEEALQLLDGLRQEIEDCYPRGLSKDQHRLRREILYDGFRCSKCGR